MNQVGSNRLDRIENNMAATDESINDKSRKLFQELCDNPDQSDEVISRILSDFRILTREKTLKLEDNYFEILVRYSKLNIIEAQKCLSNLILNYPDIREPLVDPYVECVKTRMTDVINKKGEHNILTKHLREVLYYDLRILFLLSALCPSARGKMRDELLNKILQIIEVESDNINDDNQALIIEGLKTLFNLTLDKCVDKSLAGDVIQKLFKILQQRRASESKHEVGNFDFHGQLLVNLIHLLTNMPEEIYRKLTDEDEDSILSHLDSQLKTDSKQSFRENVLPILNVCTNICKHSEHTSKRWFEEILGSSEEYEKRPEEYDTLRGRLVKLMTSVDVHIKDIAADFLHALCGCNTEKFITYTGFGNAAAFLSSRGLLSQSNRSASSSNGNGSTDSDQQFKELRDRLDPITGKIDTPRRNPMEGMSEEEKGYHAEELATAITKLSNLGIIKPMQVDADGNVTDIKLNDDSKN